MKIHPKGLPAAALFAVLLIVGADARWGLAAIAAVTVIDGLSFLLPLTSGPRERRPR